ncbi:MAG: biosynthetic arginine decarboxylase [Sandaracinaceae bacterium]
MDDDPQEPVWNRQKSADLYQINRWGNPYFRINAAGNVEVGVEPGPTVDLYELTRDLEARGLDLPLLIRFTDVLGHRIRHINECFGKAIAEYDYKGAYRGVFPVKVNQQRHFVDEVVHFGKPWKFGLEAGSKPELLIALSAMEDDGGLIICNGYKDRAYIETALLAQLFGKTVLVVLERIEELDHAFAAAEKTGVRPALGVRAKLSSRGVGRWNTSTGDRAKFGLSVTEIVQVVDRLAERDMLDCLQLLHFHIGSQISSIIPLKNALREAAHIYVELAKMGAKMGYLDVGGGLAVDYDGSKTDFHASMNYDEQEYAYDVVAEVKETCDRVGVPVPTLVSESGRAISAHQSVLVMEVVGKNEVRFEEPPVEPGKGAHRVLEELFETWQNVRAKNLQESLHDAQQGKEEADSLFKFGYITLRQRAEAERLYWYCLDRITRIAGTQKTVPEEVSTAEDVMSAIYYCNFSVFQSAPDVWAIDQLFPIMPIHRLHEEPTERATLADLTCDSDGKVDRFIDFEDVKHALEVHPIKQGERYFLAMFLNGAYQEILGDLHNLFGDTNAVHVRLDPDDGYEVTSVVYGDSVKEVLGYVEYEPQQMVERVRLQAERARRQGLITIENVRLLMRHYEESLRGYTYLTGE